MRPGDLIGVCGPVPTARRASPVLFLSHGYPAEVIVHNGLAYLVSERDEPADLLRRQHLIDVTGAAGGTAFARSEGLRA